MMYFSLLKKRINMSLPIIRFYAVLILFIGNVAFAQTTPEMLLASIKNTYAPDKRVAIFEVEFRNDSLIGKTNLPEARTALLSAFSKAEFAVNNVVEILPNQLVGEKKMAFVNVSVANLRSRPAESAELASQALLGMPLKIYDKKGGWLRAQTPDGYIGWVSGSTVSRFTENQVDSLNKLPKIIYTKGYGFAFASPNENAQTISDLTWGNALTLVGEKKKFYEVRFPDNRTAFIPKNEAVKFDNWLNNLSANEGSLVETSKKMMGLPYLWGGTSWKGVDCSGFTRTIYLMNGMLLPRDASQQVHVGEAIDTADSFDELQPGDLLFFGRSATNSTKERVIHVGMWIGNDQFIHSSGMVRLSSFNKLDENFDEYNFNRFLRAKRMIKSDDVVKLKSGSMY
ncbi:MAG: cell wall-associated NlpC family hydrolase [Spirosomataceae bacterium]|jgi:cell wall-associated NlpC family hydrolase